MNYDYSKYIPVTDPVLVFSIILFLILLAPILLNRLRIPSIVGLILAGVVLGPNGFHILERDNAIILFGTVGVLYIMFLAGLEIDLNDFSKHKKKTIVYGLLTFTIPIVSGTFMTQYFLQYSFVACVLIASTFSSNTLVAYPIASRLGIVKNIAVSITVGGTIITDTLALVVLAIITSSVHYGSLDLPFIGQLLVQFILFALFVIFGFPRIAKWYFKNAQADGVSQYIFVMAMVFLAAFLAKIAGLEPIIGAFLAGLALNRLVPHASSLMNRLEFVGNAIFIPFFLISVGMLVDLRIFWTSQEAIVVALLMTTMAFIGKWIPAFLTQKIFRLSATERRIIFGLSAAHAAATLAVVLEGYKLKVLNDAVLNGTVVMILVTCLVSSFVVEQSGRALAITENDDTAENDDLLERILIPFSDPITYEKLIDFALLIKHQKSIEPIYAVSVVEEHLASQENIIASNKMLEKIQKYSAASGKSVQVMTRVDTNIAVGISRAAKDLLISEIVLGWGNAQKSTTDILFGTTFDQLLRKTERMLVLSKIEHPVNTIGRIVVAMPPKAEFEKGFSKWFNLLLAISKQTGAAFVWFCNKDARKSIELLLKNYKTNIQAKYHEFDDWDDFLILAREVKNDDLFVTITARTGCVSYENVMETLPKKILRHFKNNSCILIYPEVNTLSSKEMDIQTEGMSISPIQENINRLSKLGKTLKNIIKK